MSDEADDVRAISTLLSVLKPLDADTRVHVLEYVLKRLGVAITIATSAEPLHAPSVPPASPPYSPVVDTTPHSHTAALSAPVDIRTFASEKNARTINEKVAVVAYYLAHLAPVSERKDTITTEDIKPYFIQAGFLLPTSQPAMSLTNAKNAGYLNALDRGQYKLNAVGYNLVAHKLPGDGEASRKPASKIARPKAKIAKSKARKKAR